MVTTHTQNMYRGDTKEKQKGVKAYQHKRISERQRNMAKEEREAKELQNRKQQNCNSPSLSIITVTINGLNPIKRQRVAEQIEKKSSHMLSTKDSFQI